MSKTIVITGGGRGIGRATAVLCAQRGWSVALQYRGNRAAAEETVGLIEQAGGHALAVQGDVSSDEDVIALFEAAAGRFGPLHGVVNNAGIVAEAQDVADMTTHRLRTMFETNVLGAFLVAREAARRLSTSRGGVGGAVVNVSSAASRLGSPHEYVDYAASKGAVDTMTLGARAGARRRARQRRAPRPDRDRHPRLGRTAGPRTAVGLHHPHWPPGQAGRSGRDHRLAALRCGVVRDRCAAGLLRRALTSRRGIPPLSVCTIPKFGDALPG